MYTSTLFDDYYHDLGVFLYLIPIISAFWAAFALLAYKKHSRSQAFLAACFIVLGLGMTFSFWFDRYTATDKTEILRSINPLGSIFCSLFVLFYFISLIQPKTLTRRFITNHLAVAFLFSGLFIFLESVVGNVEYTLNWEIIREQLTRPAVIVRLLALAGLLVFEMYVAIRMLKMYFDHKRFIREAYSYEENINLNWIGWCIALFAVFAVADLLWMTNSSVVFKILFGITSCISIISLFWMGFRQEDVPTEDHIPQVEEAAAEKIECAEQEDVNDELSKEPLYRYPMERMKTRLTDYFEKEKPYLNPELNLGDVAQALHTNKTYLSQLINGEFQMNFYTFVNQYRIRYAIALIEKQNGQKLETAQLITESGFKSRSVFYKQFRDTTGYSPFDYIRQQSEKVTS
ncbi:helix-turn-helix domain-containing protein [Parabacteroides sp. OttesenSCG-928-G06]|nr:helix-turn-helix domain-containing protein [Parabacteroides sp. OttesenSCG-928-G06]